MALSEWCEHAAVMADTVLVLSSPAVTVSITCTWPKQKACFNQYANKVDMLFVFCRLGQVYVDMADPPDELSGTALKQPWQGHQPGGPHDLPLPRAQHQLQVCG